MEKFDISSAMSTSRLTDSAAVKLEPMLKAVAGLPQLQLELGDVPRLRHGQDVRCPASASGDVALVRQSGELVAIAVCSGGRARPRLVLF